MQIHCAHTRVVALDELNPNPRNPNQHPSTQIQLLAKILKAQGWRNPIVVSKRSGLIVKGHGRLQAAQMNGWLEAPIDEQDYANDALEYADMVADNTLQELSMPDLKMIAQDILDFGPELDVTLLALPGFEPTADEKEKKEPKLGKEITCPACGVEFVHA